MTLRDEIEALEEELRKLEGRPPKPKCIACEGTGRNSRGGPCIPCSINKLKTKE